MASSVGMRSRHINSQNRPLFSQILVNEVQSFLKSSGPDKTRVSFSGVSRCPGSADVRGWAGPHALSAPESGNEVGRAFGFSGGCSGAADVGSWARPRALSAPESSTPNAMGLGGGFGGGCAFGEVPGGGFGGGSALGEGPCGGSGGGCAFGEVPDGG